MTDLLGMLHNETGRMVAGARLLALRDGADAAVMERLVRKVARVSREIALNQLAAPACNDDEDDTG